MRVACYVLAGVCVVLTLWWFTQPQWPVGLFTALCVGVYIRSARKAHR